MNTGCSYPNDEHPKTGFLCEGSPFQGLSGARRGKSRFRDNR